MADALSIETAAMQLTSQLNDGSGTLNALEIKLDTFNTNVEIYLFDKMSERKYSEIIESNADLAGRLQQLTDDEGDLLAKIHQAKSLLQDNSKMEISKDISKMEIEIKTLAADEKVLSKWRMAQREQEIALESILKR